ncbi:MAG TPA: hypothetical protein VN754_01445, partial [Candidatus Binataceae bacterium]|nr:hypothetical protein [Candidatus Binataceae bacterium]
MATRYAILPITAFGMVGGFINAFLTDQGLTMPSLDRLPNGQKLLRPGFAGNVIVGGVAAIILAGLYSPLGAVEIGTRSVPNLHLTIGSLAAALLSGIGGARLLTQEVENRYTELINKRLASGLKDL